VEPTLTQSPEGNPIAAERLPLRETSSSTVYSVNNQGLLDFNAQFKPQAGNSDRLVAKGLLHVDSTIDGWFLIRVEGWLAVTIDGKLRIRRSVPNFHARGWDALPLHLDPGSHLVKLECRRTNEHWSLAARFIDQSGHAPAGANWQVPWSLAKAKSSLDPFDVSLELSSDAPFGLRVRIDAPLGTPVNAGERLKISLHTADGSELRSFSAGSWPGGSTPVYPFTVQVGLLNEFVREFPKDENDLTLNVDAGPYRVRRRLRLPREVISSWQSVAEQLEVLNSRPAADLDVARASLQTAIVELTSAATEDKSALEIHRAATRARTLSEAFARGEMPWTEPGIHELAWRSSADESLQRFALQVPRHTKTEGPLPLVLVLHGYNGTSMRILDAFLDNAPGQSPHEVQGFVLAPAAHGNAFYRGPGERDILEILEWASRSLPVDANKFTITGASMGGTGTAEIALHYPDRFAAQAPLCGYHSYFVRRDTSGQPIRVWERKLMHRNSAASSADSGRYLPMQLAHGLKDKPLENSRVLTTRYKTLGYRLSEDWPDLGHAVWKKTWAHAGLFPWLSSQERTTDPPKITIAATSLRHAQSFWLNVVELDSKAELSTIDVEVTRANELRVVTQGVTAFAFKETRHIDRDLPLALDIDGTILSAPAHSSLRFVRSNSVWRQGLVAAGLRKVIGAEGPWLDLWNEPLAFVYGTGKTSTIGVNLNVARALASPRGGIDYAYPVLSDLEYLSAPHDNLVPILVGNSADHAMLARWSNRLPISVEAEKISFGGREFSGDHLGAIFVYPNPDKPSRMIGVITAPTPGGLWQSLSLPQLLPDFVIFDARVAPAAGEPILGRRGHVLAAGFFNSNWSIPSEINDPLDDDTALH
jgi:predicted esterase